MAEEFLLLVSDATKEDVTRCADKIRLIAAESYFVPANKSIRVTLSAGIATFPEDGSNMDTFFKVAYRRLYLAKEAGRNRISDWRDEIYHGN